MIAIRLRTEYLKNPMGIDVQQPRLMWNCAGGVKQTAYQIVTERWNSGKVQSSAMQAHFPELLHSRMPVRWKVRLWDENDEPGEYAEGYFEMGLLHPTDWQAKWITGNYRVNRTERYPVDCFRRTVEVRQLVVSARLYITACGLYEARLDGKRIGDFYLAPGITDYRKRVQYQTYDVTELLSEGSHDLTVQLADGWYRGSCGAWGRTNQYGTETKLLAQLEITYSDGSRETIGTDENWEWSNDGPIRFADNKDGEIVDARCAPTYSGRAKQTNHSVTPTASDNVPVTEHERFRPVITTAPNGRKLLDFGQNLAGYVTFRVNAHAGQRMLWRFGEMLDADGNLTLKNIQLSNKKKTTPLQQIDYTCAEGVNEYKTTFAVFGFQYAEVETDVELDAEAIEAVAVYSDLEETSSFSCSNELLNRFYRATIWSTKSNSLDLPTDCPTRERHGWTGDAQIFYNTASYLFCYAPFGKKYIRDMYDWQRRDGCLPHIIPDGGADFYMYTMNGSVGWADAGVLMPYRMWKKYGDAEILHEYYDRMAKYAAFMIRRISRDGVVRRGQSYGEWAEPADVRAFAVKDFVLPHPEESTAYTAYVLRCMAEIARALGKTDDVARYQKASDRCKEAYRNLVQQAKHSLDTDRQAKLVRPLAFDLLDAEQTAFAKERLLLAMEHYGWRLGTGFLSTPLILDVLSEIDIEAAYQLLENEELPGWLSMPKAGATTIWEAWEGPNSTSGGIGSLNHYSKGAVCEWLFKTMCGIRVAGENHFVIAPQPGGHFTFAEASYNSVYGKVESGWRCEDGRVEYTVTIPANTTAEFISPDGTRRTLHAGENKIVG